MKLYNYAIYAAHVTHLTYRPISHRSLLVSRPNVWFHMSSRCDTVPVTRARDNRSPGRRPSNPQDKVRAGTRAQMISFTCRGKWQLQQVGVNCVAFRSSETLRCLWPKVEYAA